ncbi:hypothetical protein AOLI_G00186410 [Acnodon oligacanthus]
MILLCPLLQGPRMKAEPMSAPSSHCTQKRPDLSGVSLPSNNASDCVFFLLSSRQTINVSGYQIIYSRSSTKEEVLLLQSGFCFL